jgi:ferritin-like metal-binding protein YciE
MSSAPATILRALREAHGMEHRSLLLLKSTARAVDASGLRSCLADHARETMTHLDLVERLLAGRGGGATLAYDVREGATADGLRLAVTMQQDSVPRMFAAVYAYEHFEIATYEVLRRLAEQAFDGELLASCEQLLSDEREAVEVLAGSLDEVAGVALLRH